jgi:hypothetical protein
MAPVTRVIALDTETTGLDSRASIWEIGICPCLSTGPGQVITVLVQPFGPYDYLRLPQDFRKDYEARYDSVAALDRTEAAAWLKKTFTPHPDGTKPILVGTVPGFDDRVFYQSFPGFVPPWHHHTQDIVSLTSGYLRALEKMSVVTAVERDALRRILELPYQSEVLSRAVGVEPPDLGSRHTAGSDAHWAARVWDAVHRGDPSVLSQYWEAAAETLEETP